MLQMKTDKNMKDALKRVVDCLDWKSYKGDQQVSFSMFRHSAHDMLRAFEQLNSGEFVAIIRVAHIGEEGKSIAMITFVEDDNG
jgi:hypothetical protein